MAKSGEGKSTNADIQVRGVDRDDQEATQRLRDAVTQAGGPSAVSRRSGVALSALNTYLAGRDMRRATLVAIAKACGVSVEWLATGHEDLSPGLPSSITFVSGADVEGDVGTKRMHRLHRAAETAPSEHAPAGLFETVELDKFVAAMNIIETVLKKNSSSLTTQERARAYLLTYDELISMDRAGTKGRVESTE